MTTFMLGAFAAGEAFVKNGESSASLSMLISRAISG
jgi:hypothetical protein